MTHVDVKPHPGLDPAAWRVLVHPVSGGLLDAGGKVPPDGRPWLNDGFTARMLTDGAILRADHAMFAKPEQPKPAPVAAKVDTTKPAPVPPAKVDPAA